MAENCLFCKIANDEIPAALVAESDDAVAFRDINPKAPSHILVIPRRHVDSLLSVDDPQLLGALLALAAQVARDEGIAESGFRIVINTGPDGGQTVDHLHLHVLGRRRMNWPPG